MNQLRLHTLAWIVVSAALSVSAQTATQGNAAPVAPAASQSATISGCMQESWGRLLVSDSSGTYMVRGSGVDLSSHANHIVTVRGVPDTKAAQGGTTPFYALQVQDTGSCGANGAVASGTGAQPGQPAASSQPGVQQNTAGAQTTNTQQSAQQTPSAATPGASPNAPTSMAQNNSAQASTNMAQNNSPQASTSMGSDNQPGGAATPNTQQPSMENKGSPAAGTPSNSVGAPASSGSTNAGPQSRGKVFQGCLAGDVNNYQFKSSDGKTYRLQGNTTVLKGMTKHQVELTGEEFNGKAIEVNGARDLGASCSK